MRADLSGLRELWPRSLRFGTLRPRLRLRLACALLTAAVVALHWDAIHRFVQVLAWVFFAPLFY